MASYRYAGITADGRSAKGSIEAASERAAYELLGSRGVTPTELTAGGGEEGEAPGRSSLAALLPAGVPLSVRALFVRELATFIHADIPLLEALEVLRRQEHHALFREILEDVRGRVQGGESFSQALSHHPRVFPTLLVSMVRVGETGGVMGPVLDQMASWMENEEEVRGEIQGALAYPAMIVGLGTVTLVILLTFVLPRITAIFAGMEANLPLPTKILMGLSSAFAQYWVFLLGGGAAAVLGVSRILATGPGRRFRDRFALGAPVFGSLGRKAAIARFSRACAALLGAGVPLLEALRVVRGLLGNSLMEAMVDHVIRGVTQGRPLSAMFAETPYFPPAAIHLLRVGERTGRLPDMFQRVAQAFEKQTRQQIKVMLNLLSPLMIVGLAVMVAMIAISILLPIFQMNKMMR